KLASRLGKASDMFRIAVALRPLPLDVAIRALQRALRTRTLLLLNSRLHGPLRPVAPLRGLRLPRLQRFRPPGRKCLPEFAATLLNGRHLPQGESSHRLPPSPRRA